MYVGWVKNYRKVWGWASNCCGATCTRANKRRWPDYFVARCCGLPDCAIERIRTASPAGTFASWLPDRRSALANRLLCAICAVAMLQIIKSPSQIARAARI